jgi:hypothetical protein
MLFGKVIANTKARMKEKADLEFALFARAMHVWNVDRSDSDNLTRALHHFVVYDTRTSDYESDPTGLSLPAERAVLSSYWFQILGDFHLLNERGHPSRWNESAASFWDTVALLDIEHKKLSLHASCELS